MSGHCVVAHVQDVDLAHSRAYAGERSRGGDDAYAPFGRSLRPTSPHSTTPARSSPARSGTARGLQRSRAAKNPEQTDKGGSSTTGVLTSGAPGCAGFGPARSLALPWAPATPSPGALRPAWSSPLAAPQLAGRRTLHDIARTGSSNARARLGTSRRSDDAGSRGLTSLQFCCVSWTLGRGRELSGERPRTLHPNHVSKNC